MGLKNCCLRFNSMVGRLKSRDNTSASESAKRQIRKQPLVDKLEHTRFERLLRKNEFVAVAKELQQSPASIKHVIGLLDSKDEFIGLRAILAIAFAADNEKIRETVIAALVDTIKHGTLQAKQNAVEAFKDIAQRRVDITTVMPVLVNALDDNDNLVCWYISRALFHTATNGLDISDAIPKLITRAADEDENVAHYASSAIDAALENKTSRRKTIAALIDALDKGTPKTVVSAVKFIGSAASKKFNVKAAVPSLVEIVKNEHRIDTHTTDLWGCACNALEKIDFRVLYAALAEALKSEHSMGFAIGRMKDAAKYGSKKERDAVTRAINSVIQSRWFTGEANKNSPVFEFLSTGCADIMDTIRTREVSRVKRNW